MGDSLLSIEKLSLWQVDHHLIWSGWFEDQEFQWQREKCQGKHDDQEDGDNTLLTRFLDVGIDGLNASEGSKYGNHTELHAISPVKLVQVDELGYHSNGSDHGDVLVSSTHNLRNHVVSQEQWTKDHPTCNTSHTA